MIIGYVRVSTDEQARGVSPARQIEQLCAWGVDPDHLFIDDGYSGKSEARPAWQRVLALLAKGKVTTLVTADLSRLHRNARQALAFAEEYVVRAGMNLVLLHERVDLSNAAGKLQYTVVCAANQFHSDATSDKTRAALAHKRAKGEKLGGKVPYGWQVAADGRTLVPDEAEQRAITYMQELRTKGSGATAIATALRQAGHRTKSGGTWWDPTTVRRVLTRATALSEGGPSNVRETNEAKLA